MTLIDLLEKMSNKFDYEEYVKLCLIFNLNILPIGEYAQRVGLIEVAKYKYTNLSSQDAYKKFIGEMNSLMVPSNNSSPKSSGLIQRIKNCSGCKRRRTKIKKFFSWMWRKICQVNQLLKNK